jgi:hypothetical protein
MYISIIDKTKYLDNVWVKTFKNKDDMAKWLYNSVTHSEDDLYKEIKIRPNMIAKPGCSFLDTHYFEEGDFNIPIKDFFKKLKEVCKVSKDNADTIVSEINIMFATYYNRNIDNLINYKEVLKEDIRAMEDREKRDFYKSFHHSSTVKN